MKKITVSVLLLIILLLFTACGNGEDGTIYYPLSASPASLDPQFTNGDNAKIVINNCFEGLVRTDKNNALCPGVAESWEISADGTVYTFHLRKDARWKTTKRLHADVLSASYGDDWQDFDTIVTAEDFVFSFQRGVDPQTDCPNAASFFVIKNAEKIHSGSLGLFELGVTAFDKYTLVITLENPCVDFLERLTESQFMPCSREFFELTGGRYGLSPDQLLCNGPFYVSAWENDQLTLTKNSGYSGNSAVIPAAVSFSFNSDPSDVAEKLSLGKYSAAVFNSPESAPQKNVNISTINDSVTGFCFNCADPVFSNENIRLAFAALIDPSLIDAPDSISQKTGSAVPKCCMAGSLNYHDQAAGQIPDFPVSAASAPGLWQKGLEELELGSAEIKLLCTESFSSAMRAELQIWQKAFGIALKISIETVTDDELESRVSGGDYQLAFAPIHSPSVSAAGFLASFTTGNTDNVFRYYSPQYDSLAEKILSIESQQDILNTCFTAERHLVEHGVFIPVFDCPTCFVQSKDVADIVCSLSGDNVCFIWAKRFD